MQMGKCEESKIIYNTKTLEKIAYEPDAILQDEESFWQDERPQQLTKLWAKSVNYPIHYDKGRKKMREWADIPLFKRKDHIFMENAKKIIDGKQEFLENALPHLCSYLPKDADLNVTAHFTAFIPSRAFAHEDIVVNVNADYWKNNVDNILNTLIHEIFHAGYGYCRDVRTEERLKDENLYSMLDNLHNEGICTYVGYKALSAFPAPDEKDYKLIDNMSEVERLLKDVNEVFSKIGNLSKEELQKLVWEKCVIGRGYYVVGALMCRVIEEKKGRKGLIETLTEGPVSFLKLYNSLVKKEMQLQIKLQL